MSESARTRYLAKLKRLGQLSFEERLTLLMDPGSLELIGATDWDSAWALSVIGAQGTVEGRRVFAYATNFLADGGTFGKAETALIVGVLERAAEDRAPVVALLQSNGARVSEGYEALAGNASLFFHMTRMSGVVPQLTACHGLCSGIAAYIAGLSDLVWMVSGQSYAFTTSPAVVKVATGRQVTLDELGSAEMHARKSGLARFVADSDRACIAQIRCVLGYSDVPAATFASPEATDVAGRIPRSPFVPYDVRQLITAVVDQGSFLEVQEQYGTTAVTGFARLEGRSVGLIANQSKVRAGAIEVDSARKCSRFCTYCDNNGLPLIYLVDVPGIMVSPEQEQAGVLLAGSLFFHAVDTNVPRIALVVRKCFGGAFVMLQPRQAGGDCVLSYPEAQIGITGADAAFTILHGKEYLTHDDPASFRKDALAALRGTPMDAASAQRAGIVDRIITPESTRAELVAELARIGNPVRSRKARSKPNLPC